MAEKIEDVRQVPTAIKVVLNYKCKQLSNIKDLFAKKEIICS